MPYEAISKRRAAKLLGEPSRHRFILGRGMVSDDTEHSCIVAQALAASGGREEDFGRALASGMRWWLLGLPAGIGFATLRATIKLWLGFGARSSGVFSAGNGPAMRCAVIGAAIDDPAAMARLVSVATRITHTDPKAEHGALAVALAAHLGMRAPDIRADDYVARLRSVLTDASAAEFLQLVDRAAESARSGETTEAFAESLGLGKGITGYVYDTVPVCLHAWMASPRDYRLAVTRIIRCGGDTDTTAAIVGGIVGSAVGRDGIPPEWLGRLFEWPRTVAWMERLAASVERSRAQNAHQPPPRLFGPWLLLRNAFFTVIVFIHVGRRCLPPY